MTPAGERDGFAGTNTAVCLAAYTDLVVVPVAGEPGSRPGRTAARRRHRSRGRPAHCSVTDAAAKHLPDGDPRPRAAPFAPAAGAWRNTTVSSQDSSVTSATKSIMSPARQGARRSSRAGSTRGTSPWKKRLTVDGPGDRTGWRTSCLERLVTRACYNDHLVRAERLGHGGSDERRGHPGRADLRGRRPAALCRELLRARHPPRSQTSTRTNLGLTERSRRRRPPATLPGTRAKA